MTYRNRRPVTPAREYGTRPAGTCADCGGEVTYTTTPSMGYLTCKGTCGKSSLRGQSPRVVTGSVPS